MIEPRETTRLIGNDGSQLLSATCTVADTGWTAKCRSCVLVEDTGLPVGHHTGAHDPVMKKTRGSRRAMEAVALERTRSHASISNTM